LVGRGATTGRPPRTKPESSVKTTFVDSGLLLAVAQGEDDVYEEALAVLDDPEREFVSSVYVRLEVLPMAHRFKRGDELDIYEAFFGDVSRWVPSSPELSNRALVLGCAYGLGAVDALHVAAAEAEGAEVVTSESPTKPMFLVTSIKTTSIRQ
jgi:predicted nucleic acid-binding protein